MRRWIPCHGLSKPTAVLFHESAIVRRCESKIQFAGLSLGAINPADPAFAGGESVPEPGQFAPSGNLEERKPG